MGKSIAFGLGPAVDLTSRTLTITRLTGTAGSATTTPSVGASDTSVIVSLPKNQMYVAQLVDVRASADAPSSTPDRLHFHTGSNQFPGPKTGDRLAILSMEDESSSSSSCSSQSSSSSSSSSCSCSESSSSSSSSCSCSESSSSSSSSSSST